MGETVGIDLRAATCAVARLRDGTPEVVDLGRGGGAVARSALVPAGGGAGGPEVDRAVLAAVAARVGGGGDDTVVVAVPPGPGAVAERSAVEQAAVAVFPAPLVVPRPVAAAAWLLHRYEHARDVVVAVLDVDARGVEVALVRRSAGGIEVAGAPARLGPPAADVDLAAHLDRAVDLLDEVTAGARLATRDLVAITVVGASDWLEQLALQATLATGVTAEVDPEAEEAVALGAALLAAPGPRGPAGVVAAALAAPAVAPHGAGDPGSAAGGMGATVGGRLAGSGTGSGGVGATVGARLAGDGDGEVDPGATVGAAIGGAGTGRVAHKRVLAMAAAVLAGLALLVIGGGALLAGDESGAGVETAGADGTVDSDSDSDSDGDRGGDGEAEDAAPTTTTTTLPADLATTAPAPGTPGDPATGPVPGAPAPAVPPPPGAPAAPPPADTTPPSVSEVSAGVAEIDESCPAFYTRPQTVAVSARVTDPSGLQSVTVTWSGHGEGALPMTPAGDVWQATIGPLPDLLDHPAVSTLSWAVTAVDGAGNQTAVAGPAITVHGC